MTYLSQKLPFSYCCTIFLEIILKMIAPRPASFINKFNYVDKGFYLTKDLDKSKLTAVFDGCSYNVVVTIGNSFCNKCIEVSQSS